MQRRFQLVDVFGGEPYRGNPLGVVLDGDGLSADEMQRLARWLNLSETAFLLPPESPAADYRVRIFTLARELPFAGHPTLGSGHAWLSAGGRPRTPGTIIQECGAGLVRLRSAAAGLSFAAPALIRSGPVDEAFVADLATVLRIARGQIVDARWVDNGPGWVGLLLRDAAAVLAVEPDASRFGGPTSLDIGLVGPYPPGPDGRPAAAFEVRALFSDDHGGMVEDPVTGSLNASLAGWLLATGRATAPYVASQGTRLGRVGRVRVDQDPDGTIWVGGATVTAVSGAIDL